MADTIPPSFREFVAERAGSWPKLGDINYPVHLAVEAAADYIDMVVARCIGERLEPKVDQE